MTPLTAYPLTRLLPQHELADALPEGVLHPCHRFVDYSETADGVSVQFEGPDGPAAVEASLLVGCDGSQSLVREQLLGDGPPKYLGENCGSIVGATHVYKLQLRASLPIVLHHVARAVLSTAPPSMHDGACC